MSPNLDIGKIKPIVHTLRGRHDILWITRVWINWDHGAHAADLKVGVNRMPFLDHGSSSHKLVVDGLIHGLPGAVKLGKPDSGAGPAKDIKGGVALVVDFIKGHPVFYFFLVSIHHCDSVTHKTVQRVSAQPTIVMFGQMVGHLKVGEGNNWLNLVFEQFAE